jgi:MFS family permease
MSVSKRDVIASLGQPKVAAMLMLGFSSGLPFFLTGNTLGYWMRDEGTTLAAIGFLSWVGLAYSFKFLWAPIIDRVDAPIFGRLGRRRGWMVLTQILIGIGLVGMSRSVWLPAWRGSAFWHSWSPSPRPPRTSWSMRGVSRSPPTPTSSVCFRPPISSDTGLPSW